jgi:hypothetical protein
MYELQEQTELYEGKAKEREAFYTTQLERMEAKLERAHLEVVTAGSSEHPLVTSFTGC